MKKENLLLYLLLVIIIIMLIIIIRQNNELLSQLNSLGNYLSEKIDSLSSYVKALSE